MLVFRVGIRIVHALVMLTTMIAMSMSVTVTEKVHPYTYQQ